MAAVELQDDLMFADASEASDAGPSRSPSPSDGEFRQPPSISSVRAPVAVAVDIATGEILARGCPPHRTGRLRGGAPASFRAHGRALPVATAAERVRARGPHHLTTAPCRLVAAQREPAQQCAA